MDILVICQFCQFSFTSSLACYDLSSASLGQPSQWVGLELDTLCVLDYSNPNDL